MMKNIYIIPTTEIVMIKARQTILTVSKIDVSQTKYNEDVNGPIRSREYISIWDDEEEAE